MLLDRMMTRKYCIFQFDSACWLQKQTNLGLFSVIFHFCCFFTGSEGRSQGNLSLLMANLTNPENFFSLIFFGKKNNSSINFLLIARSFCSFCLFALSLPQKQKQLEGFSTNSKFLCGKSILKRILNDISIDFQ